MVNSRSFSRMAPELASNQQRIDELSSYAVTYVEPSEGLDFEQVFPCWAEDDAHARFPRGPVDDGDHGRTEIEARGARADRLDHQPRSRAAVDVAHEKLIGIPVLDFPCCKVRQPAAGQAPERTVRGLLRQTWPSAHG